MHHRFPARRVPLGQPPPAAPRQIRRESGDKSPQSKRRDAAAGPVPSRSRLGFAMSPLLVVLAVPGRMANRRLRSDKGRNNGRSHSLLTGGHSSGNGTRCMVLKGFRLIRNIGCFDSFQGSADTDFAPLTLIYAENGRGKTTVAAILRSLTTGTPDLIKGRCRLGSPHAPHVVLEVDGLPQPIVFENDRWSNTYGSIAIFDDHFVDDNVYSGLSVEPNHRQNLHEVILGRQGVSLARRVSGLSDRIADFNRELREKEAAIPNDKLFGIDIDTFCGLKEQANIDTSISQTERALDAVNGADRVAATRHFSQLDVPAVDICGLETLLAKQISDLDETAVNLVRAQAGLLGDVGEQWIAAGVPLIQCDTSSDNDERCPFCGQSIAGIDLVDKYRLYFGEAYRSLQAQVASAIADCQRQFGGDRLAQFQRTLSSLVDQHTFWSTLTTLPPLEIDEESLAACWVQAGDTLLATMHKQNAPLDRSELGKEARRILTRYVETVDGLTAQVEALVACNTAILEIKQSVESGSQSQVAGRLNRLKAAKSRHCAEVKPLDAYVAVKRAKSDAESERERHAMLLIPTDDKCFPRIGMPLIATWTDWCCFPNRRC